VKDKRYYDDSTTVESSSYFSTDDIVFEEISENTLFDEGDSQSYFKEFSDELFDGKTYELSISKQYHNFVYTNDYKPKDDGENTTAKAIKNELIFELQSISASFYYYLRTISLGNNSLDIFSEPVQIYSNINGGIGLFASYSKSTYTLTIPLSYQNNDSQYYYYNQPY
jgi:hypothetical protein